MTAPFAFNFRHGIFSLIKKYGMLFVIKPYSLGACYNNVPISLYTILTTLYLMSKCFQTIISIFSYDQEVEHV
jgi:hypothetical protein